ncbi:MAG: hypothetical protein ACYCSS_06195 [Sulfuriferula sp.]
MKVLILQESQGCWISYWIKSQVHSKNALYAACPGATFSLAYHTGIPSSKLFLSSQS